jgi:hypothetical protein
MLPKLRRLFRHSAPLRLCPNCQQQTPLRMAVCVHCRQPLPALQPVQMRRSNTTIRPRSLQEKFLTRNHPLNVLLSLLLCSLLMFFLFGTLAIIAFVTEPSWQNLSSAVIPLIFALIAFLCFLGIRRAIRPLPKLLHPDDPAQEWLDKLADKDHAG